VFGRHDHAPGADLQGVVTMTSLFELPERTLQPVAPAPELLRLSAALPPALRMGAMTWSYPGWTGVVYKDQSSERDLARYGLTAYCRHPLLRLAEIDRSYYQPLTAADYRHYAEQVPDGFGFLVKAHEDCTVQRYPQHARYGAKRGQDNPRYLDADYAASVVLPPLAALEHKLCGLLLQFSPEAGRDPRAFADRLHAFLARLPRLQAGAHYVVELRTEALLTREYGAALEAAGALHCHNAWTFMPSILEQARSLPKATRRPLVIRWLLQKHDRFEQASERFAPFSRILREDRETRAEVARLTAKALASGVPACVLLDNKAEGCAPESVVRLAEALVALLA
jgi:uncharacterized protein YecE (DUF72 family)